MILLFLTTLRRVYKKINKDPISNVYTEPNFPDFSKNSSPDILEKVGKGQKMGNNSLKPNRKSNSLNQSERKPDNSKSTSVDRCEACNKDFENIVVDLEHEQLHIEGKSVGLLRKN